jgi:SAM-dependent methyltransferase
VVILDRIPPELKRRLHWRLRRIRRPARLLALWRTTPLSDQWGRDRGTPIDRFYIERFLADERQAIEGHVLEVMNSDYTERFGSRVDLSDVLDIDATNPRATQVADLAAADTLETGVFDCFILTQTLQYVYDVKSALRHAHRILRPGGTLLCTVPAASRIGRRQIGSEFWRFTPAACRRLFTEAFEGGQVEVRARGNVLTCVAFLLGMSSEELSRRELEKDDPYFPLVVTVRAIKATDSGTGSSPTLR